MNDEMRVDPGLTREEFADGCGKGKRAACDLYRRRMRGGEGLVLPPIVRRQEEDGVVKFCLGIDGSNGPTGLETESVLFPMRNYHGAEWRSVCVSSQVGCRMGCTFCETGRMGLLRNLSAGEIVVQFLAARAVAAGEGVPAGGHPPGAIRNIVFMGMGEPLDNFDAVVQAIRVLSDAGGIAFPRSRITISTVGRIDGLRRLAALGWRDLRLAISLNAADDALRNEIMPINKGMPLRELHRVLRSYPLARRGRFLIEYVLLEGVNDSLDHARLAAEWCRGLPCTVNLIPYNPQRRAAYAPPAEAVIESFAAELRRHGAFVKRRRTIGRSLMGACGQLGNSSRFAADPTRTRPTP